jgi:hypothetical protein
MSGMLMMKSDIGTAFEGSACGVACRLVRGAT